MSYESEFQGFVDKVEERNIDLQYWRDEFRIRTDREVFKLKERRNFLKRNNLPIVASGATRYNEIFERGIWNKQALQYIEDEFGEQQNTPLRTYAKFSQNAGERESDPLGIRDHVRFLLEMPTRQEISDIINESYFFITGLTEEESADRVCKAERELLEYVCRS